MKANEATKGIHVETERTRDIIFPQNQVLYGLMTQQQSMEREMEMEWNQGFDLKLGKGNKEEQNG